MSQNQKQPVPLSVTAPVAFVNALEAALRKEPTVLSVEPRKDAAIDSELGLSLADAASIAALIELGFVVGEFAWRAYEAWREAQSKAKQPLDARVIVQLPTERIEFTFSPTLTPEDIQRRIKAALDLAKA